VQEVAKLGLQLMEQIYAGRIKSIEKEKEAETERYDEEIRNIEDAGYSTEEEEARKRAAAAQTEIAQKQIDARLKEEKKKQAIANKVAAMTQAAISTALAIMNIWATVPKMDFGISTAALTATAIAIGLVQQAAILAQPLPEYGSGRAGGKAEWAITGDAGRSEVIVGRDGRATLTPSKPTLTYLHEGDKVIPSYEEYIRMTLPDIIPDYVKHPDRALTAPSVSVNISEMVEEQKRATRALKQAIKEQNTLQISTTRRGVYAVVKGSGGEQYAKNHDFNRR
jgi:hypothetical protein